MTGVLLSFGGGVLLCLAALAALVFLVIAPAGPRVPAERRRAPGAPEETPLSRVTQMSVGAIDRAMGRRNTGMFGASNLEQAGLTMPPPAFVLMVVCAAAVLASVGVLLGGLTVMSIVLLFLFGGLAPIGARMLLAVRTAKRREQFADQLDDMLSLLAGSLRAGHSLLRAIDAISQQIEAPTSVELARVVNETRIGRDLGDALELTAQRMRSEDFEWVAQAVAISQEAGGNLSDVLDQAGRTIRERGQLRRQVKALSAEGRISGLVLLALPVLVLAALLVIQPGYFAGFFTNLFGILSLIVAGILMIVGALWMRVMVRVKF